MNTSPDVFSPARLGPLTLRNRIIKAATFEAATPDALVTDDLINYHRRPAAGGVGMTTVAYCAVSPGGRTEGRQIWMRPAAVAGLRRLTDAIHAEGAAISAQIGHAGPVADSRSNKATALAPVRFFNPIAMKFAKRATRADIDDVIAAHADAARLAIDAGFDAVEIHLGHNYFCSSFLSPLINRRDDEFGGSLENRAKVARGVVQAVRRAVEGRGRPDRRDRQAQHGRRRARRHLDRGVVADGQVAAGRRRPRCPRADRGQLAGQPDVPVPRRRPGQGVRQGVQAADALGRADDGQELPASSTPTARPICCATPDCSARS